MVLIAFSNIVVDDFGYAKRNPLKRYIYFLTHMHSDHYQGISNGWDYGQIFCSTITKAVLLVKFPKVQNVLTIPMKTPTEIQLVRDGNLKVQVTFLDANHCPGAVMILFQGYFGTILHTGDMRFNMEMIYSNPHLYPVDKLKISSKLRQIEDSEFYTEQKILDVDACSIHVDELILDNTYCDPIFKFPNRDEAFTMMKEIIDKNENCRILLCVDSVGKEELMVQLAEHYKTMIVVNEQRFEIIQAMDFHRNLFTTNKDEGWIEVIRKGEVHERLKESGTIAITATGWANTTSYQMPDNRKYVIPYSLHSNFNEMHQFVRSIRPCLLQKVVKNKSGKSDKIYNITQFSQYMVTLTYLKQRGFEFFLKNYVDETKLSDEYKKLMLDANMQFRINQQLGIKMDDEDEKNVNQMEFREKHKNIFQNKQKYLNKLIRVRKGITIKPPEKNDNFKITQFIRAKKQLQNSEQSLKSDVIDIPDQQYIPEIVDIPDSNKTSKRKDNTVIKILVKKSMKKPTDDVIVIDQQ